MDVSVFPELSPEIEAVRDMVNRFMQRKSPVMDGYEKRGEFPRELVRKAGEAGSTARCSPSRWAAATWATSRPR
jgi:alkylation response protein AidB-like acyl-CoA dehydrogenase